MRTETIIEYHKELEAYFEWLENTNSEILEGLAVKDDYDGFVMELAMLGMRTLQKSNS